LKRVGGRKHSQFYTDFERHDGFVKRHVGGDDHGSVTKTQPNVGFVDIGVTQESAHVNAIVETFSSFGRDKGVALRAPHPEVGQACSSGHGGAVPQFPRGPVGVPTGKQVMRVDESRYSVGPK